MYSHKKYFCCIGMLFLFACGNQAKEASKTEIINGVELEDNNPGLKSTVFLSVGCTGTLVSDNMILTAAHCFYNENQGGESLKVHFGPKGKDPEQKRDISEFKFHENYGPVFRRPPAFINDIAWVKFHGDLPEGYSPSPILSLQGLRKLESNQPITLVGYGRVDETNDALNKQHIKTGPAMFRQFLDTDDPIYSDYAGMFVTQINPGTGVCWGDSGGPAYMHIDNRWVVAGATNGRDGVIAGVSGCSQGAARFAAIGYYQNWIEGTSGITLKTELN